MRGMKIFLVLSILAAWWVFFSVFTRNGSGGKVFAFFLSGIVAVAGVGYALMFLSSIFGDPAFGFAFFLIVLILVGVNSKK